MSQSSSASSARDVITTPAQLFAFVLERLGETEPFVRVEAGERDPSCFLLPASCFLLPASCFLIPASCLLHRLHLEKAPKSATCTVPCGSALLSELRSSRDEIWRHGFKAPVTIESLVVQALQS